MSTSWGTVALGGCNWACPGQLSGDCGLPLPHAAAHPSPTQQLQPKRKRNAEGAPAPPCRPLHQGLEKKTADWRLYSSRPPNGYFLCPEGCQPLMQSQGVASLKSSTGDSLHPPHHPQIDRCNPTDRCKCNIRTGEMARLLKSKLTIKTINVIIQKCLHL